MYNEPSTQNLNAAPINPSVELARNVAKQMEGAPASAVNEFIQELRNIVSQNISSRLAAAKEQLEFVQKEMDTLQSFKY